MATLFFKSKYENGIQLILDPNQTVKNYGKGIALAVNEIIDIHENIEKTHENFGKNVIVTKKTINSDINSHQIRLKTLCSIICYIFHDFAEGSSYRYKHSIEHIQLLFLILQPLDSEKYQEGVDTLNNFLKEVRKTKPFNS